MAKSRTIQLIIAGKDRVSKTLKRITGSLKKWGVGALKITGGLVAGFAAVTTALGAMFTKLAGQIDEQAKMAAALGIQNEALGAMRDAAGYAGISVENLSTALRKMSQNVGDAANGIGEGKDALEALGLDAAKLQKMKPEAAFSAIITELDKIPNGIKKTTLAMRLFGRSGAAMANLTSKGLKQAQKDAEALGLKLSTAQAKNVEAANDSWARIKIAASDFLKYITVQLAPGIKKGLDSAFAAILTVDWKNVGSRMAVGLGRGLIVILEGVEKIGTAIVDWKIALEAVKLVFLNIQLGIWKTLEAMRTLNVMVREFEDKTNPIKLGMRFGGAEVNNQGLTESKRILNEQRMIIAQIKKDIEASKTKGGGLLGDQEKSKTALDGFIGKVKEAAAEIGKEASNTVAAEGKKTAAIDKTTSALQRQLEIRHELNLTGIKELNIGGKDMLEQFKNNLDDEADK